MPLMCSHFQHEFTLRPPKQSIKLGLTEKPPFKSHGVEAVHLRRFRVEVLEKIEDLRFLFR